MVTFGLVLKSPNLYTVGFNYFGAKLYISVCTLCLYVCKYMYMTNISFYS